MRSLGTMFPQITTSGGTSWVTTTWCYHRHHDDVVASITV